MTSAPSSATPDDLRGMTWWNALTKADRKFWLQKADSARPVDAWAAFKQEIAARQTRHQDMWVRQ
jgi:hypothetical protein